MSISLLLFSGGVLCLESRELVKTYIRFYAEFLEDKWEVDMGILVVAALINFAGIRARRISLSVIIYSGFLWGIDALRTLIDLGLKKCPDEEGTSFKILDVLRDILRKMDQNLFFMAFMCVALGAMAFFFVKVSLYIVITGLICYLWTVLEKTVSGEEDEVRYQVYQAIMLCTGVLTLVLVRNSTFVAYLLVFVAFGSLFIVICANLGLGLDLPVLEELSSFIDNGFGDMSKNRVVMSYLLLASMGLICQILLLKDRRKRPSRAK